MLRNVLILVVILAVSLMVFKAFDKNANAEDQDGISRVLENQSLILEKLDVINGKLDTLRMRIR